MNEETLFLKGFLKNNSLVRKVRFVDKRGAKIYHSSKMSPNQLTQSKNLQLLRYGFLSKCYNKVGEEGARLLRDKREETPQVQSGGRDRPRIAVPEKEINVHIVQAIKKL
ncbi:hypothetical protein SRABI84_02112 [Peribacillus simplex]|nr:hypothetical protein SRABI84_02112 [Peribacillus simplex]